MSVWYQQFVKLLDKARNEDQLGESFINFLKMIYEAVNRQDLINKLMPYNEDFSIDIKSYMRKIFSDSKDDWEYTRRWYIEKTLHFRNSEIYEQLMEQGFSKKELISLNELRNIFENNNFTPRQFNQRNNTAVPKISNLEEELKSALKEAATFEFDRVWQLVKEADVNSAINILSKYKGHPKIAQFIRYLQSFVKKPKINPKFSEFKEDFANLKEAFERDRISVVTALMEKDADFGYEVLLKLCDNDVKRANMYTEEALYNQYSYLEFDKDAFEYFGKVANFSLNPDIKVKSPKNIWYKTAKEFCNKWASLGYEELSKLLRGV